MIAIGFLFVRMLCDCFKSRPRLEAEILVLRHQLNVLHGTSRQFAAMQQVVRYWKCCGQEMLAAISSLHDPTEDLSPPPGE